jgi:hypothetical protein
MTGVFYTTFRYEDIYLLQPVAVLVDLWENKVETAQKEKQYTEQYANAEYTFRHNNTINRSEITHGRSYTKTNKPHLHATVHPPT